MSKMIFVNLPVRDLAKSMAFYEALGFTNEPRFTDETAAAMVWSDSIFVMLLTHEKWQSFTDRPIPPTSASEVSLALAMEDRAAVDAMIAAAAAHGGTAASPFATAGSIQKGPQTWPSGSRRSRPYMKP